MIARTKRPPGAGAPPASDRSPVEGGGTRERILSAAEEEFAAHGLRGARVSDIVARAGVNERMLYHHFGDKDGLYLAVLRRYFFDVVNRFEEALGVPGDDPEERLIAMMRLYFDALVSRPNMVRLFFHEALAGWPLQPQIDAMRRETDERLLPKVASFFGDAAQAGAFREGIDPIMAVIASSSSFMVLPVILPRLQRVLSADLKDPATLAALRDQIIDIVLRGVLAPASPPKPQPRRRVRR